MSIYILPCKFQTWMITVKISSIFKMEFSTGEAPFFCEVLQRQMSEPIVKLIVRSLFAFSLGVYW